MSTPRAVRLSRALEIGVRELERRALDPSFSAAEQFRAVDQLALLCNDSSVCVDVQLAAADALREIARADRADERTARDREREADLRPNSRSKGARSSVILTDFPGGN